ncbi:SprT family zinc-dependent metalloprotease [Shewanella avicenniae]|uniref:SprT family zinc-dependent metalloprotease n=1 Tax=Shewanella avicenniae TaxID=2814294 RepID=A0ABX7QQG3_9GAMM|nr:SprT family zinc-dependent metalloprotease [Shewanella avicenniae]QSX33103.1 SprT family zinc-dependent metalloprotease [Shewanella avicenniae]
MWFSRRAVSRQPSAAIAKSALAKTSNQAAVMQRINECYQLAEQHFRKSFTRPSVHFSLRGKAAGTAHPIQQMLRFNAVLLEENPNVFLSEVVPHEVCHLLTHQLYGKVKPHGIEWKALMQQLFQLSGKVTHQLDISSVTPKGVMYRCHCGPLELSVRRHNKVMRQQAHYQCRRCGQKLEPVLND